MLSWLRAHPEHAMLSRLISVLNDDDPAHPRLYSFRHIRLGRIPGLSGRFHGHGTKGSLGFRNLLLFRDSDHVRCDLCHRLPLSRSPLAVGHKYGCGPGIRTRDGWKFAVAVAALPDRHDSTFRPPVRGRFMGKQTGDKKGRGLTRGLRTRCIAAANLQPGQANESPAPTSP